MSDQPTTIRISVPNASGAMVIGKGGSVVKSIKEKSGANVSMGNSSDIYKTGRSFVIDIDVKFTNY